MGLLAGEWWYESTWFVRGCYQPLVSWVYLLAFPLDNEVLERGSVICTPAYNRWQLLTACSVPRPFSSVFHIVANPWWRHSRLHVRDEGIRAQVRQVTSPVLMSNKWWSCSVSHFPPVVMCSSLNGSGDADQRELCEVWIKWGNASKSSKAGGQIPE